MTVIITYIYIKFKDVIIVLRGVHRLSFVDNEIIYVLNIAFSGLIITDIMLAAFQRNFFIIYNNEEC